MRTIITFDDGYIEDYTTTFPLFKKHNIKGTSFVSTNDIGKRGYISWDEMKEMKEYGWDFQCHTHNHADLSSLTPEEIEREFRIVNNEFMRHSMEIPEYHAFPFGRYNDDVLKIIAKYRKKGRGTARGKGGDYDIVSYGIHGQNLYEKIKGKEVLFLHTHDVSEKHRGFGVSPVEMEKLIKHLKKEGYEFLTVKEHFDNEPEKQTIPKIIHQIWVGDKEMPIEWINSWKEKNPTFKHILWDEKMIRKEGLVNEHIFDDYKNLNYRDGKMYHGMADVARVEILKKYGGIYIDADTECIKSLEGADFLNTDFFSVYEGDKPHPKLKKILVATGVIGSIPNHPILDEYIKKISSVSVNIDAWLKTGPALFTDILQNYQVKLLPANTFYPKHITGYHNTGTDNYGYHHWYSHNSVKHRVVIMAAGQAKRWENYLEIPKQLVQIDGEPIIHRTIRLLKERGVKNITVTVPEIGYYGDLGVKEVVGKGTHEMNRFLNVKDGEALFLYGDVFYTENLIDRVLDNTKSPRFWGRSERFQGIGSGVLEIFAIKFNKELYEKALELRKKRRVIPGGAGWNLYLYYTTGELYKHEIDMRRVILERAKTCPYFASVTDITEDFDQPKDYEMFMKNYKPEPKEKDLLYVLDDSSQWKDHEIKYSIRSAVKNIKFRKIFVVGHKPDFLKNVIHIPFISKKETKFARVSEQIREACKDNRLSDSFICMNDDFFFLQPQEIKTYHKGSLKDHIEERQEGTYKEFLKNTAELFNNPLSYEVHYPMVIEKRKFFQLPVNDNVMWRSYYGNYYKIPAEKTDDFKFYEDFKELKNGIFISSPSNIPNHFKTFIKMKYNMGTKYER
jgi:inositol phosphorylceramide mannosyltransferase catalytic subunit